MEFLRREWFWYGIRGSSGGWESETREANRIIGEVVVAVGLGRAVVAEEEEGRVKLGGRKRLPAPRGRWLRKNLVAQEERL